MDPRLNPYTPNAGARPPLLVGRDDQLDSFDVLLARLERGYTEQSMIITGLRGVGKTVLLNEFRIKAEAQGWIAAEAEITKQTEFGVRMAQLARRVLLQAAPKARWRELARRAAGIIKSFTITVASDGALTAGLDIDPVEGFADSGDLTDDLSDLLVALGDVAKDQGKGVVFLFDEVQYLSLAEARGAHRRAAQDGAARSPDNTRWRGSAADPAPGGGGQVVCRAPVQVPGDRQPASERSRRGARGPGSRIRRRLRGRGGGGDRAVRRRLPVLPAGVRQDRLGRGSWEIPSPWTTS